MKYSLIPVILISNIALHKSYLRDVIYFVRIVLVTLEKKNRLQNNTPRGKKLITFNETNITRIYIYLVYLNSKIESRLFEIRIYICVCVCSTNYNCQTIFIER